MNSELTNRPHGPWSANGGSAAAIVNALTVDVEDYFQVSALAPHIARADWETIPCRVDRNVGRLLELFANRGAKATFFTLGWIAERYPGLVRDIVSAGHEIASHGFDHQRASDQSYDEFFRDVRAAKLLLEDIAGRPVLGYRAPSFSIGANNLWAFDALCEAGYRYSSSVYPMRHDHYGMPEAPRFSFHPREGLTELPITTSRLWGHNLPAGGGGYFRLLPYAISRWSVRRVNAREGKPAIFYMHPWEIDPDQPRIAGIGLKTRFRHYINLARTEARLSNLLSDFRWDRMDEVYGISTD